RLLDAGASRLVCGTRAIREPEWFAEMAERYPGRLMLGIDARAGRVAVEGWTQTTGLSVQDQVKQVAAWPLAGIVYTDIDRDGMLQGPDVDGLRQLVSGTAHPVIASGGVSSIQAIRHS
ncbi:MAG TPA: HisA/HisF-related TIM barrel protein, partial [Pirellulaceae bacterium]|nr:HisA/HisF-related TIM barrel protein [Pirellulaceae bacterium]